LQLNQRLMAVSYALMQMGGTSSASARQPQTLKQTSMFGASTPSFGQASQQVVMPSFGYGLQQAAVGNGALDATGQPFTMFQPYASNLATGVTAPLNTLTPPIVAGQSVPPATPITPTPPVNNPNQPSGVILPNPLPTYNGSLPAGVGGFQNGQSYPQAQAAAKGRTVPPQVFYQGNQAFMNVYPLIGTPGNYTGSTITTSTQLGQLTAGEENYAHFVGLVMGYDTLPNIDYNSGPAIAPPVFNKGFFG
jgi:hypothetical protein